MTIEKHLLKTNHEKGRKGYNPKAIVLHITDSIFSSALNTFNNPTSQVSVHYLIGDDKVYQLVDEKDTAWHCGKVVNPKWTGLITGASPNLYTIGIETALYANEFSFNKWMNLARLVKDMQNRYPGIELVNHNEINAGKTCPGKWCTRFYMNILTKIV